MMSGWRALCHKAIQTRHVDDNTMSVGSIVRLTLEPPSKSDYSSHSSSEITAPYYFIGNVEGISYFILAELVDERGLLAWKKKLEHKNYNGALRGARLHNLLSV